MNKYLLYLFDFDGTLFDTLPSSKFVFKAAYEQIGINIKEEDILGYTREPIPNSYKRLGGKEEDWDTFVFYIEKYVNSTNLSDMITASS